jgi:histidinol-phosphatase (PHP family)
MFDCHVHTEFSTDSSMKLKDAIKKAKDIGIGLIITEHMDLKYPVEGNFQFDVKRYFKEYGYLKNDKVLLGIELGLRTDCTDENKIIALENPFDYVIGSIHVVNGIDIYQDYFYAEKDKNQAYEEYFKFMYECVKESDFFDSLGHIDYIARYAPFEDTEIYYDIYSDYIDEVLKILSNREKAIEVNTRRINDKKAAENILTILKRFNELGGKYVTIGSDAHNTSDIGNNFNIALDLVEKSNLKVVYFKERKMEYI